MVLPIGSIPLFLATVFRSSGRVLTLNGTNGTLLPDLLMAVKISLIAELYRLLLTSATFFASDSE